MDTSEIQRVKLQFGIIGNAPELLRAIDTAIQVARTDLTVLVTGESGAGKEFFPQIIHTNSARKHGKYFAVNCGAIPEGTIDSELFGHVKGAFTDAVSERKGYFSEADGGTIFLDEVGELPMSTQARLLRVLENGEYMRVGSSKVEKTDVRIVCATNVNLPEAIKNGRFREDLYYRLCTVPISVPPLRERGNDVLLLFKKFALDFSAKYNIPKIELDDAATEAILEYSWPGNIRQLKNIAERISILELDRKITGTTMLSYIPSQGSSNNLPVLTSSQNGSKSEREMLYTLLFDMRREINDLQIKVNNLMNVNNTPAQDALQPYHQQSDIIHSAGTIQIQSPTHIPVQPSMAVHEVEYVDETLSLEDVQKKTILSALERNHGRRCDAARELGISERTLYRKIKEYGIE